MPDDIEASIDGLELVGGFINRASFWFATNDQWQEISRNFPRGGTAEKPVSFDPPLFDFEKLRLRKPDGHMDYEQLAALFRLIHCYWDKQPIHGLIPHLVTLGFPAIEIAPVLSHLHGEAPVQEAPSVLYYILLPPECRQPEQGVIATKAQLEFALSWLFPEGADRLNLPKYLRKLGLWNEKNETQLEPLLKASAYIWSHRTDDPNCSELKKQIFG